MASAVLAAVRRHAPRDAEWQGITYMAFDMPGVGGPFSERAERLASLGQDVDWSGFQAVEQRRVASRAELHRWLQEVVGAGGEGLMLHRADAARVSGRSPVLQKLKPVHDADALRVALLHHAAATPDGEMVCAYAANYDLLGDKRPDRHALDAVLADRPLCITSTDFHCAWANTAALQAAGILQGADAGPGAEVVLARGCVVTLPSLLKRSTR